MTDESRRFHSIGNSLTTGERIAAALNFMNRFIP